MKSNLAERSDVAHIISDMNVLSLYSKNMFNMFPMKRQQYNQQLNLNIEHLVEREKKAVPVASEKDCSSACAAVMTNKNQTHSHGAPHNRYHRACPPAAMAWAPSYSYSHEVRTMLKTSGVLGTKICGHPQLQWA